MCGDLESDESLAEEFYARFVDDARSFLARTADEVGGDGDPLYAYLDSLFRDTLSAAARPENGPAELSGFDRLCMEPLVYARLAGFMAAHQPLEDDPMRRLIDAIMTGYEEGEAIMSSHAQHHSHVHEHTH